MKLIKEWQGNNNTENKKHSQRTNDTGIFHKIFNTKTSFHVKQCPTEKVQFLFFRSFCLVLKTFLFWQENWVLVYKSNKVWDFPDFS